MGFKVALLIAGDETVFVSTLVFSSIRNIREGFFEIAGDITAKENVLFFGEVSFQVAVNVELSTVFQNSMTTFSGASPAPSVFLRETSFRTVTAKNK